MKYTPVLVGAAVGFVDGELNNVSSIAQHKYAHGIFKFGCLFAGLAGEMFFDWPANVDYGLMTAASTLIGARIPAAIKDKTIKSIATYTAPSSEHPTSAGHVAAGCTSCAKAAPLARLTVAPGAG